MKQKHLKGIRDAMVETGESIERLTASLKRFLRAIQKAENPNKNEVASRGE